MKKLLIAIFLPLCAYTFITAQAAPMKKTSVIMPDNNALIGSWANVNSKTPGIDKLVIQQSSTDHLSINAFGKCSPTDCVWGNIPLTAFSKSIAGNKMVYGFAVWNMHRANWGKKRIITTVTLKKLTADKLSATAFTVFKDNSGRSNYARTETFIRTK